MALFGALTEQVAFAALTLVSLAKPLLNVEVTFREPLPFILRSLFEKMAALSSPTVLEEARESTMTFVDPLAHLLWSLLLLEE
jgi:hypothetical protein